MKCHHCTEGYVQDAGFAVCGHCEGTGFSGHRMSSALVAVIRASVLAIVAFAVFCATSCTLTIDGDGAKSFSVDGTEAAKALLILSDK